MPNRPSPPIPSTSVRFDVHGGMGAWMSSPQDTTVLNALRPQISVLELEANDVSLQQRPKATEDESDANDVEVYPTFCHVPLAIIRGQPKKEA